MHWMLHKHKQNLNWFLVMFEWGESFLIDSLVWLIPAPSMCTESSMTWVGSQYTVYLYIYFCLYFVFFINATRWKISLRYDNWFKTLCYSQWSDTVSAVAAVMWTCETDVRCIIIHVLHVLQVFVVTTFSTLGFWVRLNEIQTHNHCVNVKRHF